ncbi:MAG: tetratricopeptide repeat protein [Candidatus Symbiothrix sp.]|jgi:tetratricopeptide (TPR) repeat protein|nr:tetratricopeptide repeat protein [Candidatus Symbiothrix sp.]
MLKREFISLLMVLCVVLSGCSSSKNTAGTRWFHAFNTRYNIYYNGELAYNEALEKQQTNYQENYSEQILMFPVDGLPKDKTNPGGPFDKAIEKGVKAIKQHSISEKPEREAGKRNDPNYQAWMARTEYNPFLHNAWMLMAKAQFHNGDFLQAAGSFSYIARIYRTQPEIAVDALIWQARSYTELEWFYEAEDILARLKREGIPNKTLEDWYTTTYADLLITQQKYNEAIPQLQTAIQAEKNGLQKNRERYLLGQLYTKLGDKTAAYKAFGAVSASKVPYSLLFSSKIRQTEVMAGGDTTQITKQLRKLAKSSKNKDYLDQIYYALGNVYMTLPDTARALASYESGVEKSTQNGYDKGLNQIRLGDIYFHQRNYIKAQPNYADALSQLKKENDAYPRVAKRSEILDELVVFVEAVDLQDSLQRLSRMTPDDRLKVVNKIIADLKKKEKEDEEKGLREAYNNTMDEVRSQSTQLNQKSVAQVLKPAVPGEEGLFYFYNSQAVAMGKNAFQQKWGRRKLEDDWRRRNKSNPMQDAFAAENALENPADDTDLANVADSTLVQSSDSTDLSANSDSLSTDPHEPQFYLQQIPVTEEDIAESNLIIEDGLYNMAMIYKDKLEDYNLALETFSELEKRFPDNENKLDAYYHTYLIYLRQENTGGIALYKQKIRAEFPESELAMAMADPNYEYNLKTMPALQNSLYEQAYAAYLQGDVKTIRQNYQTVATNYAQSELLPKFMFLNALSYVQTHNSDEFKAQLKELIQKYPQADVSVLAAEMMKGFQRGLSLATSGDNQLARGGLFANRWGNSGDASMAALDSLQFSDSIDVAHELMIVYPKGSLDDNLLLYTVANFNFGNFIVNDFELEQTSVNEVNTLQIKGFANLGEVLQYVQMIYGTEGYASGLEKSAVIVPISTENHSILLQGKTLDDYLTFFETHFGKENQNLITRWNLIAEKEPELLVDEAVIDDGRGVSNTPIDDNAPLDATVNNNPPIARSIVNDSIEAAPVDLLDPALNTATDLFNQGSEALNDANNTMNELMTNPVQGIQNLFKRKKTPNVIDEYAKEQQQLEKERVQAEKERAKQAIKDKAAAEKAQRESDRQKEAEAKALQKAKEQQTKLAEQQKKDEAKAKAAEKARLQKEKEAARKAKKKEAEERQKLRQQEQKAKQKAREEARKQKEKDRKAKS